MVISNQTKSVKKRGRPRKHPIKSSGEKRPKGRPKKVYPTKFWDPNGPKLPRGRPRKENVPPGRVRETGIGLGNRPRTISEHEDNPWEHTEETKNLPTSMKKGDTKIYLGDCLEIIDKLEENSIDLLYTDPPFGITRSRWDDCLMWYELWPKIWRVMKPNGAVVVHASQPFVFYLAISQLDNFKYMWTWKKNTKTLFTRCGSQPLRQVEQICVFSQGQTTYNPQKFNGKTHVRSYAGNSQIYGNEFKYKKDKTITKEYFPVDWIDFKFDCLLEYINEKKIDFDFKDFCDFVSNDAKNKEEISFPSDILEFHAKSGKSFSRCDIMAEYFVKTYTNEGDTVLDICCSEGMTGTACNNLKRKFIGIDKSPPHYKIACERLGLISNKK